MLNIAIQHHWQAQALLIEEKDSVFFFFSCFPLLFRGFN